MTERTFAGQVAIVTGAGQGIGFEIARQLAGQGTSVILNDIDGELAEKASASIKNEGGICDAIVGDVSDIEFIQQLVDEAVARFGKLTIAIANAGITTFGEFLDYQPESLKQLMNLNLYGSFFLTQKACLQIKKQRTGGSILLMSSVTGHQAHKNLAAYGMTKAGLEMLAKSLVAELSPLNITINTIAPGATLTERTLMDTDYNETWSRITPMGRPANVQDIANAALFFVSPTSRHVTGQSLVIDGGWTAMSPSPY